MSLTPGSPEWCKVVTASKVAAILGHSPFMSQRAVYHLMRGEWQPEVTDAMRRGHYLEDGVLAWWRDQHPEFQAWWGETSFPLGDWAAATPDGIAAPAYEYYRNQPEAALIEAKTSANDDEWGRPGTDEIPTHYLTQCYWSMHVSGIHEIRVPVLTSRLRFEEYVVTHDVEVGQLLEERCRAFYDTLSADTPPPLDDSVSTIECLSRLHPGLERGAQVEIPLDLARDYLQARMDIDDADARHRRTASQLYDLLGTAQYAVCNGVTVARRQVGANGIYLRKVATTTDALESAA